MQGVTCAELAGLAAVPCELLLCLGAAVFGAANVASDCLRLGAIA